MSVAGSTPDEGAVSSATDLEALPALSAMSASFQILSTRCPGEAESSCDSDAEEPHRKVVSGDSQAINFVGQFHNAVEKQLSNLADRMSMQSAGGERRSSRGSIQDVKELKRRCSDSIVSKLKSSDFVKEESVTLLGEEGVDGAVNRQMFSLAEDTGEQGDGGAPGEGCKRPLKRKGCCSCCGLKSQLVFGVLSIVYGILTVIYTPTELFMNERLKMTPGLPPFDWWASPPDDVHLKVYIFNVTNAETFMSGVDSVLQVQEVGPIVFKEHLRHSNITFNDNDTLTYTARRWLEYLPELNSINLNDTLTVPNAAVLGLASYLHDTNILGKMAFNVMMRSHRSQIMVNCSVEQYLWNFTDPMLQSARRLVPGLLPVSNIGVLSLIYHDFIDSITVYIGSKWGDHRFFSLDMFRGSEYLPGHGASCTDTVRGSTEGLLYPQRLNSSAQLLYWRKTLCRIVTLKYKNEVTLKGVHALRFTLPTTAYHRITEPGRRDCYISKPPLPNGLSDVSSCFFNFPMAVSMPHFIGIDPAESKRVSGVAPDFEKHGSFAIVEPNTGIPLKSCARSQSNLIIRNLNGFDKNLKRFNNMFVPMFWAEYSQEVLPYYIWALIIIVVNVTPVVQGIFSAGFILIGTVVMIRLFNRWFIRSECITTSFKSHLKLDNLARNTILGYEKESIINILHR